MKPAFDGNFTQLLRAMAAATRELADVPEDQEWTQDGLATIEDIRHAALKLAREAEAILELATGR